MRTLVSFGSVSPVTFRSHDEVLKAIKDVGYEVTPFGMEILAGFPLKADNPNQVECAIVSPQSLGYDRISTTRFILQLANAQGYGEIDPMTALSLALLAKLHEDQFVISLMKPIVYASHSLLLTMGRSSKSKPHRYIGSFPLYGVIENEWKPDVKFLVARKGN